ncbi:hypothetical protein NBT05_04215 [Aquimarina sp. ERC-38]|uniref:hypothetical protein n=1 Tax=Aquimarina sp. ERC-38 TaxID=2949996 RepID=UPI0022468266|nr:hypothetical protein [Aquimarina sp. ERC-38]UZO81680.1 hypothetical protein NBT05_04215 [Aquimarina sp. ERC-38]
MAARKYNPFDHATHNLNAHKFIKSNGNFKDWEVTTAFYTALKFFEGSLFPNQYVHPDLSKKLEFESYNEYRRTFNQFIGGTPHEAMKFFVEHNTTQEIWYSYKELYDICHFSRYKNYQIDKEELEIVYTSLEAICQYCIQNQQ